MAGEKNGCGCADAFQIAQPGCGPATQVSFRTWSNSSEGNMFNEGVVYSGGNPVPAGALRATRVGTKILGRNALRVSIIFAVPAGSGFLISDKREFTAYDCMVVIPNFNSQMVISGIRFAPDQEFYAFADNSPGVLNVLSVTEILRVI